MRLIHVLGSVAVMVGLVTRALGQSCEGTAHLLSYGETSQKAYLLPDGSLTTISRMAVNADGMKQAYHRDDVAGGGLISLCNGGKPFPADAEPYNASADNAACRRFSHDYERIRRAGFKDPNVGAINWFGVLGRDSVRIGAHEVTSIVPVEQADGSGFYVSPTALEDAVTFPDAADQRRYIDAGTIPAAVVRNARALRDLGIVKATLGVAIHRQHRKAVPFIVGDHGPRIGEGSFALGRLLQNLAVVPATRRNIFTAHIDEKNVLWVFFAGEPMLPPYNEATVAAKALERFNAWGGEARLNACVANPDIPTAN